LRYVPRMVPFYMISRIKSSPECASHVLLCEFSHKTYTPIGISWLDYANFHTKRVPALHLLVLLCEISSKTRSHVALLHFCVLFCKTMLIDDAKAIHPRAINVRTPSPRSSVFAVVTTTPSRSRCNAELNRYNDTEPQPFQTPTSTVTTTPTVAVATPTSTVTTTPTAAVSTDVPHDRAAACSPASF